MAAQAFTFFQGSWLEGNPGLVGPMTQAFWLGGAVFDGARAFDGVAPDLGHHCRRVIASAQALHLRPMVTAGEIEDLAKEGIRKFPSDAVLYIRPMFYAEEGGVLPAAESTRFCLSVYAQPMPAHAGASAHLSRFRRPAPDMAPTNAKAACLYPNSGLALRDAQAAGFDNAVMLDGLGNVAEFATANLFLTKDGAVHTPALNGTFLNGITRQRIMRLLRQDGIPVHERRILYSEVLDADELFATGNMSKVTPFIRIETRDLQPGPVAKRARELYWNYAHSGVEEPLAS